MKILITGCSGYVGSVIAAHLSHNNYIYGTDIACNSDSSTRFCCDLSNLSAVVSLAKKIQPSVVVHAAGNKNIDFCEYNPTEAFKINCDTVKNIARVFGQHSRIIYISTDYVFDGARGSYYESDQPKPLTVYGRSKLCGEIEGAKLAGGNFITLRTSALYDLNAAFPRFLFEKLSGDVEVECFTDTCYSPTYFRDFLAAIEAVISTPSITEQLVHVCGEATTRYDFARAFATVFDFKQGLILKSSTEGKSSYLFKDLSLKHDRMKTVLGVTPTSIIDALRHLRNERKHEDSNAVQTVR